MQRAILDTTNDGFVLLDEAGSILDVNPAYCRLLQSSRDSLIGRPLSDFEVATDDGKLLGERLRRMSGSDSDRFDTRQRRGGGDALEVELSVNAFPDELSQTRFFCFVRDISERKRSESLRLAEAERQRVTLINEVHHRVKNNLQGVIGLLGLHLHSQPDQTDLVNAIIGKIKSIAVVFGLQSQRGEDDIRLCEMTVEVCRGAERLTGNRLPPILDISVTDPVRIDKSRAVAIGLIINELVVNALKHSRPGTDLPVRVVVTADAVFADVHIYNPSDGLPSGFDLESEAGLGTGLTLVKAMLPQPGARLGLDYRDGEVTTHLRLSAPVVLPSGR
jgi:PAS domain S-box-containing protein